MDGYRQYDCGISYSRDIMDDIYIPGPALMDSEVNSER